jgi:hypothetical protein
LVIFILFNFSTATNKEQQEISVNSLLIFVYIYVFSTTGPPVLSCISSVSTSSTITYM